MHVISPGPSSGETVGETGAAEPPPPQLLNSLRGTRQSQPLNAAISQSLNTSTGLECGADWDPSGTIEGPLFSLRDGAILVVREIADFERARARVAALKRVRTCVRTYVHIRFHTAVASVNPSPHPPPIRTLSSLADHLVEIVSQLLQVVSSLNSPYSLPALRCIPLLLTTHSLTRHSPTTHSPATHLQICVQDVEQQSSENQANEAESGDSDTRDCFKSAALISASNRKTSLASKLRKTVKRSASEQAVETLAPATPHQDHMQKSLFAETGDEMSRECETNDSIASKNLEGEFVQSPQLLTDDCLSVMRSE